MRELAIKAVKEAGGKITNLSGEEWRFHDTDLLASNGKVHDEILKIING